MNVDIFTKVLVANSEVHTDFTDDTFCHATDIFSELLTLVILIP